MSVDKTARYAKGTGIEIAGICPDQQQRAERSKWAESSLTAVQQSNLGIYLKRSSVHRAAFLPRIDVGGGKQSPKFQLSHPEVIVKAAPDLVLHGFTDRLTLSKRFSHAPIVCHILAMIDFAALSGYSKQSGPGSRKIWIP